MNIIKIILKRIYYKYNGVYTNYSDKKKLKKIDEIIKSNDVEDFPYILKNENLDKIKRKKHPVKLFLMEMDVSNKLFINKD